MIKVILKVTSVFFYAFHHSSNLPVLWGGDVPHVCVDWQTDCNRSEVDREVSAAAHVVFHVGKLAEEEDDCLPNNCLTVFVLPRQEGIIVMYNDLTDYVLWPKQPVTEDLYSCLFCFT